MQYLSCLPSLRHNLGSLLYVWYLAGQVAVAGEEAHAGVLLVAVHVLRHRAEGASVRVRVSEVANLVTSVHKESTPFPCQHVRSTFIVTMVAVRPRMIRIAATICRSSSSSELTTFYSCQ